MDILMESLLHEWQNLLRILPRVIMAVIVLIIFIGIGRLLGKGLLRLLKGGNFTLAHKHFFHKIVVWVFILIGLTISLNLLNLKGLAASLIAGGGVTAVILGFAFREIGENLLAGFMLAFSRPFKVGDLIQSEDLQGIVGGIELRYTHIRTVDGRDIYIPSSQIINRPLINFTKDGLRRPSFILGIDYGDDIQKARKILLDVVKGKKSVLKNPEPGVAVSALAPQYVELEVFFWVDTFKKDAPWPEVRNQLMDECRRAMLENGFTLSANVTNNIELSVKQPLDLSMVEK